MKILRVGRDRYFIIKAQAEVFDLALKLLNEYRVMGTLDAEVQGFAEKACDAIDGELAWELLTRIESIEVISPEPVR